LNRSLACGGGWSAATFARVVCVSVAVSGCLMCLDLAVTLPPVPPSYEDLLAENAQLRAGLAKALERIGELEARLGMSSRNSGKPPSSDGLAKPAPKSLRKKSGRGPGRPKGQPGTTLRQVEVPDHEVTHEPGACGGCGAGLEGAGLAGVERRQVFDLPPLQVEVTEHRLVSRRCGCGTVTKAEAPAGVNAPVQYGSRLAGIGVYLLHGQFLSTSRTVAALTDLVGMVVAAGSLVGWTRRIARATSATLAVIRQRLATARVVYFDETGLRVAGRLHWMHSASTSTDVLLTVHPRRGTKGGWTPPRSCRPSPGSRCATPGRRMTPTRRSPTRCAMRTPCGNWSTSPTPPRPRWPPWPVRRSTRWWPSRTCWRPPTRTAPPRTARRSPRSSACCAAPPSWIAAPPPPAPASWSASTTPCSSA